MKHYYSQEQDALLLLQSHGLPEKVVLHCKAVADTCGAAARELNKHGYQLDERLCVRAGLLHDIERTKPKHEFVGADLLEGLGMHREAEILRHHMGWQVDYTAITETELVFLADKVTEEHHRVTVRERYRRAIEMTKDKPDVNRHICYITDRVAEMEALYEKAMGKSFQDIPIGMSEELFLWNDESIGWMRSAARYSGYYEKLAALIAAYLPQNAVVTEPGAGAGMLTEELAKHCKRVTAVEIDERAVREISSVGLPNIRAVCADAEFYSPEEREDAAIYCFYGGAGEILAAIRSGKYRRVIAVGQDSDRHNFGKTDRRRCFMQLVELLDRENIKYSYSRHDLDFSQPLRDMEDARRFMSHYGGNKSDEEIAAKLTPGSGEYAYVIPAVRNIGIAVIEVKQ